MISCRLTGGGGNVCDNIEKFIKLNKKEIGLKDACPGSKYLKVFFHSNWNVSFLNFSMIRFFLKKKKRMMKVNLVHMDISTPWICLEILCVLKRKRSLKSLKIIEKISLWVIASIEREWERRGAEEFEQLWKSERLKIENLKTNMFSLYKNANWNYSVAWRTKSSLLQTWKAIGDIDIWDCGDHKARPWSSRGRHLRGSEIMIGHLSFYIHRGTVHIRSIW